MMSVAWGRSFERTGYDPAQPFNVARRSLFVLAVGRRPQNVSTKPEPCSTIFDVAMH